MAVASAAGDTVSDVGHDARDDRSRGDENFLSRGSGLLARLVRVFLGLFSVHAEIAKREAERDRDRLLGGAMLVAIGALMLAVVLVLGHAAGLVALHDRGWRWLHAIFAVGGVDLFFGLVFVWAGLSRMRAPVMTETRTLLKRTVDAMTARG